MLRRSPLLPERRFLRNELRNPMRQASKRRSQPDHGALSRADVGHNFTVPEQYRARSLPKQLLVKSKVKALRSAQAAAEATSALPLQRAAALDVGADRPRTLAEKKISDFVNNQDLGLGSDLNPIQDVRDVVRAAKHEDVRRERLDAKLGALQPPTAKEYSKLMRVLLSDNRDEGHTQRLQKQLAEEFGVYPAQRMDAFMLSDDSVFPEWVNSLPPNLRDRVKFGAMGLTEADEATRVRLARMPRDQREAEWARLRAARSYEEGLDKPLSPTELRNVRQGRRTYVWLQQRRRRQVLTLRRLAQKKPERFEAWPSHQVDYSQRLAVIAQHIEAGVPTHGQWPLDREELARAKLRREREADEAAFLRRPGADKGLIRRTGNLAQALAMLEDEESPTKRLSRKKYAHRVNNVVQGVMDEHGRNPRKLKRVWNTRFAATTERVKAVERELRNEPRLGAARAGAPRSTTKYWAKSMKRQDHHFGVPAGAFSQK